MAKKAFYWFCAVFMLLSGVADLLYHKFRFDVVNGVACLLVCCFLIYACGWLDGSNRTLDEVDKILIVKTKNRE